MNLGFPVEATQIRPTPLCRTRGPHALSPTREAAAHSRNITKTWIIVHVSVEICFTALALHQLLLQVVDVKLTLGAAWQNTWLSQGVKLVLVIAPEEVALLIVIDNHCAVGTFVTLVYQSPVKERLLLGRPALS